jgi:hypothetical protein
MQRLFVAVNGSVQASLGLSVQLQLPARLPLLLLLVVLLIMPLCSNVALERLQPHYIESSLMY